MKRLIKPVKHSFHRERWSWTVLAVAVSLFLMAAAFRTIFH